MLARFLGAIKRPWLLIILVAVVILGIAAVLILSRHPPFPPVLLQGVIVTPDRVIPQGWVLIENGRIQQVSDQKPDAPGAIAVDTQGLIFPGLIDLHNHVSYNVLPRWNPGGVFTNRGQWRASGDNQRLVGTPYDDLTSHHFFCDMNTYGELRALVGGTTSILATASDSCIQGLVRNLDSASGFYLWPETDSQHIRDDVFFPENPADVTHLLNDSRFEAYVLHLAEGTDATARQEFNQLVSSGLLTAKTVIVHGTALQDADFQAMHAAGASLVWSPRSNVELYGATADIRAAASDGVPMALAPDWAITGSSNMLAELRYASGWNTDHLGGLLTDEQLVNMVTTNPAAMAGIDDEVGAIRPGLYADLLVISGDSTNPYRALIESKAENVRLVVINGAPIYGDADLMAAFWANPDLVSMPLLGMTKMLKMPTAGDSFEALQRRLSDALAAENIPLAPIAEN